MLHGVALSGALAQQPAGDSAWLLATTERPLPLRVEASRVLALRLPITMGLDSVTLEDALQRITLKAGLGLTYGEHFAELQRRISLHAINVSVAEALTTVVEGTGLDLLAWSTGHLIVVRRPAAARPVRHQGVGTVAGRVTDAVTRSGLDQVALHLEGTSLGALTASDGRYTIRNVPVGAYHVTARRVGYTPLTKTATVGADSAVTVDFALAGAPTKLSEVVTTAVGDQRRYEVGNVISTINADSIAPTAPVTSLTDLISARAPGVQVEESSGLTGAGEAIRIRGQSSLVLQGDPIVIVDGVREDNTPGSTYGLVGFHGAVPAPARLNDLDFKDIQSIDVLKGPAASTEYGTDAASGVIVITTKHGTAGRPQWKASAEQTASAVPVTFPDLYYSWGHTTDASHSPVNCPLVPYAFGSGYGSSAGTCAVDSVTKENPLNSSYYSIFGTGARKKYDLSVSGGTDAIRYYVSGGLSNETGVLRMPSAFTAKAQALGVPNSVFKPNSEDQRSLRSNTAIRLGPTTDLAVTGAYSSTYQTSPAAQVPLEGVALSHAFRNAANQYGYDIPYWSPIYQLGLPNSQQTDRLTGGLSANARPAPWFLAHATVGVDHGSQHKVAAVLPEVAPLYRFVPPQLGNANVTTDIYTADLRGSATVALARATRAMTSIGLQLADTRTQGITATATGITTTNFTLNGAVNPVTTQVGNRQATLGGYAEEQLGLWDRLFLTGAVRVDAGSGFGSAYSTAVYPKASLSWLAFGDGPTTIRLRAAFGESGVQPPNGAALQLYAPTTSWLNGGPLSTVGIANAENPRLQPERSEEYEGGIDVGLWQNQVSLELTGYAKTTHNALVSTGTGWELGAYPYAENVGQIRNTGIEGSVTATVMRTRAMTWDLSLNASVNHNKLIALAPGVLSQQVTGQRAVFRFVPGYPLYGYWAPRVQYADLNHDGVLERNEVTVADSLSYVGSSVPTREASLGTHVGLWGGAVSVGALVDYRGGGRLLNTPAFLEAVSPQSDRASNVAAAPLWQQARDVAGQTVEVSGLNGSAPPAGFYEDATYMRFRELSLTYAVPRGIVRALRVQSLSVTGAVRNLAIWTRYTGADPEVTNSAGANTQLTPTSNTYIVNNNLREDGGTVPLLRYWVMRLNLGL